MFSNKVFFTGHVARPEGKVQPNGKFVFNFSVGVEDGYFGTDGVWVSRTLWIKCVAWDKLGERMNEKVEKGMPILIEGKLSYDSATGNPKVFTRQDGTPGASFEVTVQDYKLFKSNGGESKQSAPTSEETPTSPKVNIPF